MSDLAKKMTVSSDLEKNIIFQNLQKSGQTVNMAIAGIEYPCTVQKYDGNALTVFVESPVIGGGGECRTNFVFNNNYHYFDSMIAPKDESHFIISIPEVIYKNIQRKHERMNVLGSVFMKFKIMIQSEKQEFEHSSLLDERVIFQEVKKPRPSVEKILTGIKNLVSEYSQKFQVKVFKPNEKTIFEEKLVQETKKIFLIYDSYEDSIEERRFYEEQILTLGGAYEHLISQGKPRQAAESMLLDLLQQKRNARIYSECIIPLMLEGEVVGYLRLINDTDYHRPIKPSLAYRTAKYAGILVEALVKYDYFTLESGKTFDIEVVDIGVGGLLFKLEKPRLIQYLIQQTILQMSIKYPSRVIETRGLIMRIDRNKGEYGVKFQEINEADMKFIAESVETKTVR